MEGCPLDDFDKLTPDYNESTCSPESIMDELGNVKGITWLPLIAMKEELINHMKEDSIADDIPFSKIDELSDSLIEFMKDFNGYKNSMDEAERKMKFAIDSNQKDIEVIQTFIDFLSKIDPQITESNTSDLQTQITNICNDIINNSNIKEMKDNYIKEKMKFHKHLNIIKLINQMNVGSTCSICFQDNVDSYFNPCGHTACSKCMSKTGEFYDDDHRPCPLCRKQVISIHKLFFA